MSDGGINVSRSETPDPSPVVYEEDQPDAKRCFELTSTSITFHGKDNGTRVTESSIIQLSDLDPTVYENTMRNQSRWKGWFSFVIGSSLIITVLIVVRAAHGVAISNERFWLSAMLFGGLYLSIQGGRMLNDKSQVPYLAFRNHDGKDALWIGPFRNDSQKVAAYAFANAIRERITILHTVQGIHRREIECK